MGWDAGGRLIWKTDSNSDRTSAGDVVCVVDSPMCALATSNDLGRASATLLRRCAKTVPSIPPKSIATKYRDSVPTRLAGSPSDGTGQVARKSCPCIVPNAPHRSEAHEDFYCHLLPRFFRVDALSCAQAFFVDAQEHVAVPHIGARKRNNTKDLSHAHNLKVAGSNPAPATFSKQRRLQENWSGI